ncbi:MAG: hypothetical protein RLZZ453_721 [Chlamydiota bacterium]
MNKLCKMEYGKDEKGQDILLKDGKFQVMMAWEKPYMHACIDALQPKGDVLEIGFGLGFSAERIQSYNPKSHTIVEFHPEVLKKAREWAKSRPNVILVEGTWQEVLPSLGVFDSIFFDDYPLESEEEMDKMKEDGASSSLLLQQGEKLMAEVHEQLPFLNTLRYSDEDLHAFFDLISPKNAEEARQVARFFLELASRSQITQVQLQQGLERLLRLQLVSSEEITNLQLPKPAVDPSAFAFGGDRFYDFLSACLRSHMREGSHFSCFLSSMHSRLEDEKFFQEIILNPFLEFHEETIEVDIPEHCAYFNGSKPLVITITKK